MGIIILHAMCIRTYILYYLIRLFLPSPLQLNDGTQGSLNLDSQMDCSTHIVFTTNVGRAVVTQRLEPPPPASTTDASTLTPSPTMPHRDDTPEATTVMEGKTLTR